MTNDSKADAYRQAQQQLASLLSDLDDPVAAMATVSAILFDTIPAVSWVGFYCVVEPGLLRVGPYQGPVGCLEIPFGQGVCGTSAALEAPQVVPDVHAFPGHIACDAKSRSEIVVPVFDAQGDLVSVLDLDSHQPANFDSEDLEHLQRITALLQPCL
jgi:L-methionine (R)-S-oxide reductase